MERKGTYVERDKQGRLHFVVRQVKFYAGALIAGASAAAILAAIIGAAMQPYLSTIARVEVRKLEQRINKEYRTNEESKLFERDMLNALRAATRDQEETARLLDLASRRLEIMERRIDRLYEQRWPGSSSPGGQSASPMTSAERAD